MHPSDCDEVKAVGQILSGIESPVVFEFGAFDGMITDQLLGYCKSRPALWAAWECDPRNISRFKSGPAARSGVRLVECAIGDHDGQITLHQSSADDKEWTASSSTCGPSPAMAANFPWLRFREQDRLQVPCRSLDSYCQEHGVDHIDVIWCDVEGAERKMIEGGRRMLAKTRYLFCEVWQAAIYQDMWTYPELLGNMPGWSVVRKFHGDVLLKNDGLGGGT